MKELSRVKLVIGIGNPGETYRMTYHNVGMLGAQYLPEKSWAGIATARWKLSPKKHFRYRRGQDKFPTFVIPTGFMNESGQGAKEALMDFDVTPDSILLIHDDSDLPLGEYKISFGQGPAGHKGVASVINTLGTKDFWRARVGIRKGPLSGPRRKKAETFVLKHISRSDFAPLARAFDDLRHKLMGGKM